MLLSGEKILEMMCHAIQAANSAERRTYTGKPLFAVKCEFL